MKIIAYYLPQYHPFEENNKWWGVGFTEWTNVGKAKKLFRTHYQPKIPADLGYYDLRMAEVRQKQIELAIEAGVTGFCYWHYWFGDGKRLLDLPFREVLESKKPDFPFCLGWANDSWKSKVWNSVDSIKDKILMEQKYPGNDDIINHFYEILPAIRDHRYIKIDNKPVFVVYKPLLMTDAQFFIKTWNDLAILNGITDGFFFIGHTVNIREKDSILKLGFDAVNIVRNGEYAYNIHLIKRILISSLLYKFLRRPLIISYKLMIQYLVQEEEKANYVYPSIIPNWDHTPRSGYKGSVFHNSTPELFAKHVKELFNVIRNKKEEDKIVFLKSWNEWGEGNYMEPDLKFGKKYIEVLGALRKEEENK